jgi:hypothetical protein
VYRTIQCVYACVTPWSTSRLSTPHRTDKHPPRASGACASEYARKNRTQENPPREGKEGEKNPLSLRDHPPSHALITHIIPTDSYPRACPCPCGEINKKAIREEKKRGERGVVCQCYSTPKPQVTPRHHPTQTLGDVQTEACLHHPSSGILLLSLANS